MTTVGDVLKQKLELMMADTWAISDEAGTGIYSEASDIPRLCRPAWCDGDDFFILPEGWEWIAESGYFENGHMSIKFLANGIWRLYEHYGNAHDKDHSNAPDAFRAAQKWIDEPKKNINELRSEISLLMIDNSRLIDALHDAIERPQGVVPDSAYKFYNPNFRCTGDKNDM